MSISNISGRVNESVSAARQNVREYVDEKAAAIVAPKSAKGINGWVFDIPGRESIDLSADITDHTVESGSFITDHIVFKPIRISLSGYIGELVYERPTGVEGALQQIGGRLEAVDAYLGDYTPGMLQKIQGTVTQAERAVGVLNESLDRFQNVVGALSGESQSETRQEKAYNEIYALWAGAQILTVQTPWKYYDNMMIESISVQQGEESTQISDFSITLKQVRFSEIETTSFDENLFPIREQVQSDEGEDQGVVKGQRNSFAFDAVSAFGGEQ